ncbi:hypothetical protein ACFX13_012838 [Malus domestica]
MKDRRTCSYKSQRLPCLADYHMKAQETLQLPLSLLSHLRQPVAFSRFESATPASSRIEEHGFESTIIADVLKGKGKSADGSWLWCTPNQIRSASSSLSPTPNSSPLSLQPNQTVGGEIRLR